jgi:hypothetical protein
MQDAPAHRAALLPDLAGEVLITGKKQIMKGGVS